MDGIVEAQAKDQAFNIEFVDSILPLGFAPNSKMLYVVEVASDWWRHTRKSVVKRMVVGEAM